MVKKYPEKSEKCQTCGEPIKNPSINYCLECGEIVWRWRITPRVKIY